MFASHGIFCQRVTAQSLSRTGTGQLIDQTHSGRAAPTGHQVVAGNGVEATAAARRGGLLPLVMSWNAPE